MELLTNPHFIDMFGWCATAIAIYAFSSRTMIPLRVIVIVGCGFGLVYGALRGAWPTIAVNATLLPLNIYRLLQMRKLIADARATVQGPTNFSWLRPFMQEVDFPAGSNIFRKGDLGAEAYLIGSGEVFINEHNAVASSGALLGEIGLLTRENRRTASATARSDVRAWRISYTDLEQLCIQNPAFCLHLARIIVQRYQTNLAS
jgi:CRP/FNR family cyclic AMP-dependent transcriptional regulator